MIRFIKKVEWCEAKHLHLAVPLPDNISVYCEDYMPYRELPIVGLASMEVADKVDKGRRVWTSKVSATLPSRPSVPNAPMSIRLTAVDGTQYIMGLSSRPHPVITVQDKFPDSPTGQCSCIFSATMQGSMPILRIEPFEVLDDAYSGVF